jgi:S1-C subfamily serine protease
MNRRVFLLLLWAMPCMLAKKKHSDPNPQEFSAKVRAVRPSIVEIWVDGRRNGTGFVVSDRGHILTAIHVVGNVGIANRQLVVEYKDHIEVAFNDGTKLSAVPVRNPRDDGGFYDMALLKVDRRGTVPLELSPNPTIPDGSDVYMTGFPLDLPKAVTYRGTVASTFPRPVGTFNGRQVLSNQIQVQAPRAKGFSGCPLLDYGTDKVIGVVVTKLGGITQGLQSIGQTIVEGKKNGRVTMLGVDPNDSMLQLIGVMDAYLSAGSGFAVSVEYIAAFVKEQATEKR